MMNRLLVTGCGGFVGGNIVHQAPGEIELHAVARTAVVMGFPVLGAGNSFLTRMVPRLREGKRVGVPQNEIRPREPTALVAARRPWINQPLMPVRVMPWMKWRWAAKKRMTTGSVMSTDAAIMRPKFWVWNTWSAKRPRLRG